MPFVTSTEASIAVGFSGIEKPRAVRRSRIVVDCRIHLTDRALQDLISVEEYSIETWGKRVSNRYIGDIEAALQRLSDNPGVE